MSDLVDQKTRLAKLKALGVILANAIDECESMRDLAALSRQYRETIREIEEIEGVEQPDDEIKAILSERESDGITRAVRKDRTKV